MGTIFTSEFVQQKCSPVFPLLLGVGQLPVEFQREPWEFPVAVVAHAAALYFSVTGHLWLGHASTLWPSFDSLSSGMLEV